MIIRKHIAESVEDGTIFNAKVEVETESREEWDSVLKKLVGMGAVAECDTVCHCNVKVNAETIAQILDYDARGEVAPYVPSFPEYCE